jgi:hypothetical protein
MKTFATAFTFVLVLVTAVSAPTLAVASELRSGDRVEGAAAFFMCGAREDLATMQALERAGDRQTALKVGMERCEQGRRGYKYVVMQSDGDAVCIRRDGAPYCLWAQRASLQPTPSE